MTPHCECALALTLRVYVVQDSLHTSEVTFRAVGFKRRMLLKHSADLFTMYSRAVLTTQKQECESSVPKLPAALRSASRLPNLSEGTSSSDKTQHWLP